MSYIEEILKALKDNGLDDEKPEVAAKAVKPPPIVGGAPPKYGKNMTIEAMKGHQGEDKGENPVHYTKLKTRVDRYKVAIGGKLTIGKSSETLDSAAIKQRARDKHGADNVFAANIIPDFDTVERMPTAPRASSYAKDDGGYQEIDMTDTDAPLVVDAVAHAKEWKLKALIWVNVPVDPKDPKQSVFYSHVCRPKAFHHSSLGAGREVLGAGEWIVEGGKLMKISANSGHYQPSITSLHQSVMALSSALQPETTIFLWNRRTLRWEDVPAQKFIKDPTGGDTYWPTYDAKPKQ